MDDVRQAFESAIIAAALSELDGNDEAALRLYTEAVNAADALGDGSNLREALDRLFAFHRRRKEYEAAVCVGERSLALWRVQNEPPNESVLTFMNNLAQMHYRAGRTEPAAKLTEEVIAYRQQSGSEDSAALALALLNLGTVRQSQGDFVSADSHFLRALAMRRHILPADDPAIVEALEHISNLYVLQKEYRRAIPYEVEMLAITRRRNRCRPRRLSDHRYGL